MECIHCKGLMKKGIVPFTLDRHGYHVHWERIPAWVCSQCGEPYFEAREVELMQKAIRELDRYQEALLQEAV